MPASSLLTLIDDIASTLDDVAAMTKVATKKTAGVLGDDLALNAQQVSGVNVDRELPVVFAVAKGSAVNKLILIPSALAISLWLPSAISWLLILGGAFLCFEGAEKVLEKLLSRKQKVQAVAELEMPVVNEKEKIKGAIRTDFILSAEIIVITLGSVAGTTILKQFLTLSGISILMTVGVYGLVALIVKLDDLGLYLIKSGSTFYWAKIGQALLLFAPWLMKFLGVAGTLAMFMVGGGILHHNVAVIHHYLDGHSTLVQTFFEVIVGFSLGLLLAGFLVLFKKTRLKKIT